MASLFKNSAIVSFPSSTSIPSYSDDISMPPRGLSWFYTTAAIIAGLLLLEQTVYRYKKRHLPGASWTIPVIGKFMDSLNPSLDNYKVQWASGALSAVSVFNIFIVIASTNDYARKIFNSPTYAEPMIVHAAKAILCPDNWVFLNGKVHVDYRRGLNLLFTHKALALYTSLQDSVCRRYFNNWIKASQEDPTPKEIMMTCRNLNMEISLRVFCGQYISEEAAQQISREYWDITLSLELVNFPIPVPGTKVYRAIQARKRAMVHLERAARLSKESIAAGNEPECMLEQWVQDTADPTYKGRREFSDREMAMVIFSFLFASQDAMSSSVIYGFQHLADYPEVCAKVREEQERVRAGRFDKPITYDQLDDMPYLRAFVKETLRIKPPVTMVPYKATRAFPISEDYTVPAGSMIIPSVYPSLHDPAVYETPDEFLPERWLDPAGPAAKATKNWMVFGAGPHKCIGEPYVYTTMMIIFGNATSLMDFTHHRTPDSDKVQMIATLFPKDGCLMRFSPRTSA